MKVDCRIKKEHKNDFFIYPHLNLGPLLVYHYGAKYEKGKSFKILQKEQPQFHKNYSYKIIECQLFIFL